MVEVWQAMAEGEATEHSEKEGRKEGWQVILRNRSESQVVLYHPENKQLAVNGSVGRGNVEGPMGRLVHGHGSSGMVGSACPYCGAQNGESWIWEDGVPAREPDERAAGSPPYMASNYFRLLEMSSFKDHQSRGGRGDDSDSLGKGALNEGYYRRFFAEERRLGTGSKGSVFLCQHVMDDVPLGRYAVKKIPVGNNHQWLVNVLREVKILEGLHHPNIIEYKHTWLEQAQLSDFGAEVPCLFVLTEYANDGNLAQYMLENRGDAAEGASSSENADDAGDLHARRLQHERKRRRLLRKLRRASAAEVGSQAETNVAEESLRVLPEHLIWKFFAEIVAGLEHLHRHGIVHRDIKPQNLLLHVDKGDQVPRVLISDFGECQILAEAELRARTGATGTVEFTAPELLRVSPDGGYCKYDERCDIWSLGVVLYQMAYSKLPWRSSGGDADALIEEIAAYQHLRPDNTVVRSLKMRMLINSMLVQDPDERPTAGALLDAVTSLLSASDEAMSSPRIPSPVIPGNAEARNAHDSADARNNMSGGRRAGEPVTPLMLECGPPEENDTPLDKDPVLKTVRSLRDDSLGPVPLQRGLRVARLVLGTLKVLACSKLSCGPFLADLLVLSAFVFELLRASFRWTPREHAILATAQAAVLMAIVGLIGNRSCLGSGRSDVLSAAAIAVLCAASVFTEVGTYLRAGLDTDKYAPGFLNGFLNGFLKTFNPSRAQKP